MTSVTLPSLSSAASPASPSRTVFTSTSRSPSRTMVMLRLKRTGSGPGMPTVPATKKKPGRTSRISPWGSAAGNGRGTRAMAVQASFGARDHTSLGPGTERTELGELRPVYDANRAVHRAALDISLDDDRVAADLSGALAEEL